MHLIHPTDQACIIHIRICFMLQWRFLCIQLNIFPDAQQTLWAGVTISVYYLVMHTHMKPDSTVDTLWVLHVITPRAYALAGLSDCFCLCVCACVCESVRLSVRDKTAL